ncbi:unnamed protein product [Camellia sinensis]
MFEIGSRIDLEQVFLRHKTNLTLQELSPVVKELNMIAQLWVILGGLKFDSQQGSKTYELNQCTWFAEHQNSGLEPVVVAAIPTLKFNREAFNSMQDAQCTICLGEYQEKEVLRIMPKCGHNFHLSCIDVWLRKQATCPVCRLPLQDSFETKHIRLAAFDIAHSVNSPEISIDHSQQWLLPGTNEHSEGNGSSNQGGNSESTSGNRELTPPEEAQTR